MTSEYSFPVRFGNIFAGANIRALHVSASPAQIQINPDAFKKTGANLAYANIQTIGAVSGGVRIAETQLGERVLHWVDYREGENLDVLRQAITPFTSNNEPVVVLLSWDEKQGKVMTPKREALVRDLVQAGVSLVIGTGVMAPFEQKLVDGVPFYFSLGSAFEKFQTGDASKKSVALEMQISLEGKLEVAEKNLNFTAEKGLEILP
jgi:poly-gamma-glutamate capsule biosynthesis protein CapA/YwtB (metallophosphatase superfamily)